MTLESLQPSLRLQLLGLPCIVQDAAEVPLAGSRPIQLLTHLAVRRSWQSRDELARLFWPDRTNKIAHSNLRNLLFKTAAAAPFATLETTEHALRLRVPCDLDDFEAAVQRSDWEAVVRIGVAELLQGYESNATEPYQQWLHSERQTVLTQWIKSVQALLAQSARPIEQRQALAELWAHRCPYDEEAVQARVALAFERRQPGAAAAIYRAFEASLQSDFGVRPSRALERFALEETAAAAQAERPMPAPGPGKLRLFGRRFELGQLKSMLADGAVRLITLTGPGGVGKSTLIAALHAHCVADGSVEAWLVDASAAQSAQAVIATIAAALGIEGLQGEAQEVGLAATLRDRRCLLMIDGAEQPGLAAPLALLLQRCPLTRLLLASQGRLHLDQEQVLAMEGFPLPDADESDADVLASNDGVRYFIDVMNQAGQRVNLAQDAGTLAALVNAVEGLPLALKLLGQLTRMFALPQLLDSVRVLMAGASQAASPELGELMPGLLASFQRSWSALAPAEQAVLARLAVFPAAFDVSAARAVVGTELPIITSLVDRSLVRAAGVGRLSLHAGIRACLLATCPLSDGVVLNYIEHYAQRLATLAALAQAKSVRPFQQFLRDESRHVEHTWRLALRRRAYSLILLLVESLAFEAHRLSDFGSWFVDAEHMLSKDENAPLALRALLLAVAGRSAFHQGALEFSAGAARAALRMALRARHRAATCVALGELARAYMTQGKVKEARALIARLEAMRLESDQQHFAIRLLDLRAMFSFLNYEHQEAIRLIDQLVAKLKQIEYSSMAAMMLSNKHMVCVEEEDLPQALRALDEAIELAGGSDGNRAIEASLLAYAVHTHLELGNVAQALSCAGRANAISRSGPQKQLVHLQIELANAAVDLVAKDLKSAGHRLAEVLAQVGGGAVPSLNNRAFLCAAMWFRLAGERSACVDALEAVRTGANGRKDARVAEATLRELGQDLGAPSADAPRARAVDVAEFSSVARRRMLATLDEMQRSGRL